IEGGAAAAAGLKAGDEIVAIDGRAQNSWEGLVDIVRKNPGKSLLLSVKRGQAVIKVPVTPVSTAEGQKLVGKIGAAPRLDESETARLRTIIQYPLGEALLKAAGKTWDTSVFSLKMMGKMVTGDVSWKNLSGPITIADYAGQSAQMGWMSYVTFLALISISLGILNLLPIPLLDGGHLMYYVAEIIKGSPVSEQAMEIGTRIGFFLLLCLTAFAFYNDINRLLTS
nr:RIP metalloprotease RseP [Burkholderiales bacterium]